MRRGLIVIALVGLLALLAPTAAGAAKKKKRPPLPPTGDGSGGLVLNQIGTFNRPIHADNAPGTKGVLYVVESEGVVRVLQGSTIRPVPFLDISAIVRCCGEEGLFSIAFHPKYERNRLFYVYFTNSLGDLEIREFKRHKKLKFVSTGGLGRPVLYIPHPIASNHNGGQLQFGPDGLLYLAPGDGGANAANAQNLESLLGKILRIDPQKACTKFVKKKRKGKKPVRRCVQRNGAAYTPAATNPFVGRSGRDEIFAMGLRNPWRFSFDAHTGALALGDVGAGCREEINYRGPGRALGVNFGWPNYEGTRSNGPALGGTTFPIHEYDNSNVAITCPTLNGFNGVSVIAGYVVRDPRLLHQYGRLLYTDAGNADIRSLIPFEGGAADDQSTGLSVPAGEPFSFAQGFKNQLFLVSGAGPLYALAPG